MDLKVDMLRIAHIGSTRNLSLGHSQALWLEWWCNNFLNRSLLVSENYLPKLHCVRKKTPAHVLFCVSAEDVQIFTKFSGNV